MMTNQILVGKMGEVYLTCVALMLPAGCCKNKLTAFSSCENFALTIFVMFVM